MRTVYNTCDHCGKRLNDMTDYVEYDGLFNLIFESGISEVDLCSNCLEELKRIVIDYCTANARRVQQ